MAPEAGLGRSAIMRAVRSKDTKPEMIVRRLVYRLGYRYRLHRADLPGKPDLVFPGRRKIVFVHGCWWHGHDCRRGARMPKTNLPYWQAKIARNQARDRANHAALTERGWEVATIWECQTRDRARLAAMVELFLGAKARQAEPGQAAHGLIIEALSSDL
jgi:DNA mismatch endonuclease (patch repair protein)